jgi:hypothetical protein
MQWMLENLFQWQTTNLSINFCMKLNPGLNTTNMATKQNNKAVCGNSRFWIKILLLIKMHRWLSSKINNITFLISLCRKGKAVPLQAWSGPESCRKLKFQDYMTTAPDGGKVVSLMHRPLLPPENACSWYSFLLETENKPLYTDEKT